MLIDEFGTSIVPGAEWNKYEKSTESTLLVPKLSSESLQGEYKGESKSVNDQNKSYFFNI